MNLYGDKMSLSYDVLKCYKQQSDDCIHLYEHDPILGMQEIIPKFQCGKTHADMYEHFFSCIRDHIPCISNGDRGPGHHADFRCYGTIHSPWWMPDFSLSTLHLLSGGFL